MEHTHLTLSQVSLLSKNDTGAHYRVHFPESCALCTHNCWWWCCCWCCCCHCCLVSGMENHSEVLRDMAGLGHLTLATHYQASPIHGWLWEASRRWWFRKFRPSIEVTGRAGPKHSRTITFSTLSSIYIT